MIDYIENINITNFDNLRNQNGNQRILLLDVRTIPEYNEEHIAGAINVPLDDIDNHFDHLQAYDHIYVYCRTGKRSHRACEIMMKAGITATTNLQGGIVAWKENHLPTDTHHLRLSIDRQFKLIAGFLILAGVFLAQTVHLAFIGLTVFVGCGLTFAGSTNICLLVILLTKMPWNNPQKPTLQPMGWIQPKAS